MDTKVQLTKLNNINYFVWKYKMQLLLTKEKVWYTIKDTRPAEPTNKWLEDDATALSLIGLNVEDNQNFMMNKFDAKSMM